MRPYPYNTLMYWYLHLVCEKVTDYDKHLKKARKYSGRNVVRDTRLNISMNNFKDGGLFAERVSWPTVVEGGPKAPFQYLEHRCVKEGDEKIAPNQFYSNKHYNWSNLRPFSSNIWPFMPLSQDIMAHLGRKKIGSFFFRENTSICIFEHLSLSWYNTSKF